MRAQRVRWGPAGRRPGQAGWLLATIGVILLATVLSPLRTQLGLPGALLCLLLAVVAVAFTGGLRPAVAATITADYLFVPPFGSLYIAHPADAVGLIVFLAVAATISSLVDRLTRRNVQAARARAEAEALARLAGSSVLAAPQTLPGLVAELRRTFDLDSTAILIPDGHRRRPVAQAGGPAPARPEDATPPPRRAQTAQKSQARLSHPEAQPSAASIRGPESAHPHSL